jgi:NADPH-dependent 2,4-dienoyl-CoA reductase/sulfur reductase-like enzyme
MVQAQPAGTVTARAVGVEVAEGGGAVTSVELSDGARLPCDYLLLATGSSYAAPIKPDHARASNPEQRREEIAAAHEVGRCRFTP